MTCDHHRVIRTELGGNTVWLCANCADVFLPAAPVPPLSVYVAQDREHDVEVMVTIWPSGDAELATRPFDSTWSWGPPIKMEKR